jgi:hypothetical protein
MYYVQQCTYYVCTCTCTYYICHSCFTRSIWSQKYSIRQRIHVYAYLHVHVMYNVVEAWKRTYMYQFVPALKESSGAYYPGSALIFQNLETLKP